MTPAQLTAFVAHEARCLLGGLDVERARELHGLVRDDADHDMIGTPA